MGTDEQGAHFPGRVPLDAYGNGGFRFAEMSHKGSILCLPSGIWSWEARTPADITIETLRRVVDEAQGIEMLLIGTGDDLVPLKPEVRAYLKDAGIGTDVMATGPAARTYNVLMSDERRVAAALLAVESAR